MQTEVNKTQSVYYFQSLVKCHFPAKQKILFFYLLSLLSKSYASYFATKLLLNSFSILLTKHAKHSINIILMPNFTFHLLMQPNSSVHSPFSKYFSFLDYNTLFSLKPENKHLQKHLDTIRITSHQTPSLFIYLFFVQDNQFIQEKNKFT